MFDSHVPHRSVIHLKLIGDIKYSTRSHTQLGCKLTMDSFTEVAIILEECLHKASSEYFRCDFLLFLAEKELSSQVSETISNWITDPMQCPIKIMYLIEDFLPGLKAFSRKIILSKFCGFHLSASHHGERANYRRIFGKGYLCNC